MSKKNLLGVRLGLIEVFEMIEDPKNQIAKAIASWSAASLDGWCAVDDLADTTEEDKRLKEFQELCKPLVGWLQENYRPSAKIVVTPDSATLYVGQMGSAYEWAD